MGDDHVPSDERWHDDSRNEDEDGPPHFAPYNLDLSLITYMEGPYRDPSERRTLWDKLKILFGV